MLTKKEFKILSLFFVVSFILIFVGFFLALSLDSKSGEFIVHWDSAGIRRLGGKVDFLFIGIISFLIIFLNFLLFFELRKKDKFLGILTAFVTFFVSILIFATFMSIISVN